MFSTYQIFVVRTPRHTILVDTCTGEDKGPPPSFDLPGKVRWRNELFAQGGNYKSFAGNVGDGKIPGKVLPS